MRIYNSFAKVFDGVMREMPYSEWVAYLEDLILQRGIDRKEILDVACGTGTALIRLAAKGWDCTGIDASARMLALARSKARKASLGITFLRHDMREFSTRRKFPAVSCMYDSINYLLCIADIRKFFRSVHNSLEPGGVFIFDINTEYALSRIWGTRTACFDYSDMTSVWKSLYERKNKTVYLEITVFSKTGRTYEKISELHRERAYTLGEIRAALSAEGFGRIRMYKDRTLDRPGRTTGRVWVSALKTRPSGQ
jgi:SAM-dependent methyltransferase